VGLDLELVQVAEGHEAGRAGTADLGADLAGHREHRAGGRGGQRRPGQRPAGLVQRDLGLDHGGARLGLGDRLVLGGTRARAAPGPATAGTTRAARTTGTAGTTRTGGAGGLRRRRSGGGGPGPGGGGGGPGRARVRRRAGRPGLPGGRFRGGGFHGGGFHGGGFHGGGFRGGGARGAGRAGLPGGPGAGGRRR